MVVATKNLITILRMVQMTSKYDDNYAAAVVMSSAVVAAADKLGINYHNGDEFSDDKYQDAIDLLIDSDIILSSYDIDESTPVYEFTQEVGLALEVKIMNGELVSLQDLHEEFLRILEEKGK